MKPHRLPLRFRLSAWAAPVALAAAALLPSLPAHAHRAWLLPSATVLSGDDIWVTVDAAISNDLFYFEHHPMRLEGLQVLAPDGTPAKVEHSNTGRYRSTFDVRLAQPGTYRISMVGDSMMASFRAGGEVKRMRGTRESFARDIPADAQGLSVTQVQSRNEVFVTAGRPTTKALEPTGRGLELVPVTHPNDLVAGSTATFRFILDGQPAAGLDVAVIPGGIRYRDKLEEQNFKTDAQGEVKITWPGPGMYWLNAAPPRPAGAQRPDASSEPPGTLDKPRRRVSYTTTLEVLPQ